MFALPDLELIFKWIIGIFMILIMIIIFQFAYSPSIEYDIVKTEDGKTYRCEKGFTFNVKKITCEKILKAEEIK